MWLFLPQFLVVKMRFPLYIGLFCNFFFDLRAEHEPTSVLSVILYRWIIFCLMVYDNFIQLIFITPWFLFSPPCTPLLSCAPLCLCSGGFFHLGRVSRRELTGSMCSLSFKVSITYFPFTSQKGVALYTLGIQSSLPLLLFKWLNQRQTEWSIFTLRKSGMLLLSGVIWTVRTSMCL